MKYHITAPERMILESIFKKEKTTSELELCTSLNKEVLQYILESLLSKNLILINENKYLINQNLSDQMKDSLKETTEINTEILDIISTCTQLSLKDNAKFKFKKIFLNKQEELILQGLMGQVDRFITTLHKNIEKPLSEQKLIFWGEGNYGKIINSCISM